MKIAIAQINPIVGDFEYNLERIIRFIKKAKDLSCDLVIFSELVITGYPPLDLLEKPDFIKANLACLEELLKSINGIGVICGFVDRNINDKGKLLHNSAVLFENGRILQRVNKILLPTYDVFDERRYFEPGQMSKTFFYKGHKIALTICEDAWNDEEIFIRRIYDMDPVKFLCKNDTDLLINISASVFSMGKKKFREHMLSSIAKKYGIYLLYANQVGGNDSLLFDGRSTVFDKQGKIWAQAREFEEDLLVFDFNAQNKRTPKKPHDPKQGSNIESVLKGLIMGTRDYVTKCGFKKVVIGLSGGIDSALTAYIAVKALGGKNVSTLFMPSQYTSQDNYEDIEKLVKNLGISFTDIPIDSIFKEFLQPISPGYNTDNPSVAEQNIQARIRGTILMAWSNKHGSLVLSTGNKSELAVGYCTLYGDMNGGLAVISDVPKTLVYELCAFINRENEYIPQRIIEKPPSAELKPHQTDEDDLPPYEILDPILKGYIEEYKSADDLANMGFDSAIVDDVISRIHINEYKRNQAAPGLKVTSKAFGYGRRYPLAQKYK